MKQFCHGAMLAVLLTTASVALTSAMKQSMAASRKFHAPADTMDFDDFANFEAGAETSPELAAVNQMDVHETAQLLSDWVKEEENLSSSVVHLASGHLSALKSQFGWQEVDGGTNRQCGYKADPPARPYVIAEKKSWSDCMKDCRNNNFCFGVEWDEDTQMCGQWKKPIQASVAKEGRKCWRITRRLLDEQAFSVAGSKPSPLNGVSGMLGCKLNTLSNGGTVGWEHTGLAAATYSANSLGGFSKSASPFLKPVAGVSSNLIDAYLSYSKDVNYHFQSTKAAAGIYDEVMRSAGQMTFHDVFSDNERVALKGYSSLLALASGVVPSEAARFSHAASLEASASELKELLFGNCGRCGDAKVECPTQGIKWEPIMMDGQPRTVETMEGCQQRCAKVAGCKHFSYWPEGGCHLQDAKAKAASTHMYIFSGPPANVSLTCAQRHKAGAAFVLQELAATHFASLADMISMMPEPGITHEVLIATFNAVGCPNPAPDTRSWKAAVDVAPDSSSVVQEMFDLCQKNARGQASSAEAEQCCGIAPCNAKPECKRQSKFFDSNADAKRLLLEKHGRMLADYGSLFRAGKYQYLAERMSKLECDVQADGLRAYCADDVELRIVHRSIATGNAVKAVESRMASDFGPVDLEENLKKSKQIQEDAPYLKRAADGFPTMRVIRKAITRQVLKQLQRGEDLLSGKVVLADETDFLSTDGWSHDSVTAARSLVVFVAKPGGNEGHFGVHDYDAKMFFGEDYRGPETRFFELVHSKGDRGIVVMEGTIYDGGLAYGRWAGVNPHADQYWLEGLDPNWSAGDRLYFPQEMFHVNARKGKYFTVKSIPKILDWHDFSQGLGFGMYFGFNDSEVQEAFGDDVFGNGDVHVYAYANGHYGRLRLWKGKQGRWDGTELNASYAGQWQIGDRIYKDPPDVEPLTHTVYSPISGKGHISFITRQTNQMPATTSAKINGKEVKATGLVPIAADDEDEFPVSLEFDVQAGTQEVTFDSANLRSFYFEVAKPGSSQQQLLEKVKRNILKDCVSRGTYERCKGHGVKIDMNVHNDWVIKFDMRLQADVTTEGVHTAAGFGFHLPDGPHPDAQAFFLLDADTGMYLMQGFALTGSHWDSNSKTMVGPPRTWKLGQWHRWEISVSNGVLVILMDNELIWTQHLWVPVVPIFQIRPWRSTADVAGISVNQLVSTMKTIAISTGTQGLAAGRYFVIDREQTPFQIEHGKTQDVTQCRGGVAIWSGQVVMWVGLQDYEMIENIATPFWGRRSPQAEAKEGDWEVGDVLTTGLVCPDA